MTGRGVSPTRAGVPTPFERFRDVVRISEGPHATVYAARDPENHRPVALKVLTVGGASRFDLEAFDREAAVLARLSSHPHIVTLYETFTLADGRPVLVLELCQQSLAEQRFSPAAAVSFGIKIAGALETAHSGGVLHRNVRPENVLLTASGQPALADFAVARLRTSDSAGADIGLPHFPGMHVAPELLLGGEAVAATDVYGLAATLHTLLTGQPPLPVYAGEVPAASILRILRDEVRPVAGPGVPLELADLLRWALAKDPANRPPTVAWFAEELTRIETHNGWPRTRLEVAEPTSPVDLDAGRRRHRLRRLR
jgi:serine/threonine-protein kinase PknK